MEGFIIKQIIFHLKLKIKNTKNSLYKQITCKKQKTIQQIETLYKKETNSKDLSILPKQKTNKDKEKNLNPPRNYNYVQTQKLFMILINYKKWKII